MSIHQERIASGLCVRGCGRKPTPGKTRCRWCKAKQNAYRRIWIEKRKTSAGGSQ